MVYVVVWVENAGDVFGQVSIQHSLDVVSVIDCNTIIQLCVCVCVCVLEYHFTWNILVDVCEKFMALCMPLQLYRKLSQCTNQNLPLYAH